MRSTSPSVAAKYRDAAFLLPLAGLFALLPPAIDLFTRPETIFGIPMIVAYIFGLWSALILVSFWFSRRLSDVEHHPTPPRQPQPPGTER